MYLRKKSLALGSTATLAGGATGASLLAMLMAATPAGAVVTTYTVDTLADGAETASDCITPVAGSCSLRDALAADADGDTIVFAPSLSGTITLLAGQGQLEINSAIVLTGLGQDLLTIDADDSSRVFYVNASAPVTIEGLTITGGSDVRGGGLYDQGGNGLTLRDVVVTGNDANRGGGLYSRGDVTLINTVVSNNTALANNTGNGYGGGVFMAGNMVMEGSTISGNSATSPDGSGGGGGGAYVKGNISITTSTFDNNTAEKFGGGLYAGATSGTITIIDSTFSNNGTTSDTQGKGGAIDIRRYDNTVVIANTTITGNSSVVGGGLHVASGNEVSLFMDTISGNSATSTDALYSGGGVHLYGGLTNPTTLTMVGTIVSGNTAAAGPADIGVGTANTSGPNPVSINDSLIGDIDSRLTITGTGNVISTTPGLGALADNSGLTKTMALLSTSAAVDAGPSVVPTFTGNSFDQRGTGFDRVVGTKSDIGAFEIQAEPPATTTTTAPPATMTTVTPDEPVAPAFTG